MQISGAMSPQARLMFGITLLTVPTIVYGGLTILGVLTGGRHGMPAPQGLTATQQSLYRAMHAHAGVLLIFSLVLQLALDHVFFSSVGVWALRVAAPAPAILVPAGFVCLAHLPALSWVIWAGASCVAAVTVLTGIGLLGGSG
jgi:hypothetical protein